MFSTYVGLKKTVYNPAALKAVQKTSEDAFKKKQVGNRRQWWEKRVGSFRTSVYNEMGSKKQACPQNLISNNVSQEALRLQQDVRKKKQEILEKHIETQKVSLKVSLSQFSICGL